MTRLDPDLRRACEERVPGPGTLFDLACRFLTPRDREQVLALEALLSAVREVPATVADPGVALAKLSWWQQEVERASASQASQHRIVRALAETGVLAGLDPEDWRALVLDVADQVDRPAAPDLEAWRERQGRSAAREMALWVRLLEPESDPLALAPAGASLRLLSLIGQIAGGRVPRWLPLDLVARHDVDFKVDRPELTEALDRALADLVAAVEEWRVESGAGRPRSRFLAVRDELVRRRLERFSRNPRRGLSDHGSLGDLLAAWTTARRFPSGQAASV